MGMIRLSARSARRLAPSTPLRTATRATARAGVTAGMRGIRTAAPFPTTTARVGVPKYARGVSHQPKTSAENPLGLNDPSLFKQQAWVDGKWVDASSGKTFEVTDPATGKVLGTAPDMDKDDVSRAVDVAEKAFKSFRHTTPGDRQKMLLRLHKEFIDNAEDIARLIVWENGKSWSDAYGEALYAASYVQWFAGEAVRTYGDVVPSAIAGQRNIVIKQPIGVCALLVPWNFPAGMPARKLAPVIATGCTCVVKVPAETPYTNFAIAELIRRAGVPDGVVNIVSTHENLTEVGKELTENPKVRKVSFTGSTRVGKMLAAQSASTLKKLSLELGGNAPCIIFDDADIPTAVAGTIATKFRGSGQTCVCANRIYVHESIYDEFADKLAAKVKEFKVGNGFDDGVTHGPLITEKAAEKVQSHLDDALKRGAKVLAGGKREGNMFEPTVLRDVPEDCLIAHDETFGPIAALIPFKDEQHVVDLANDTRVGLAGYFFSKDSDRIWRVAEALEVGMVGANTGAISQAQIPFGGVLESGSSKEGGYQGTEEYLNTKVIAIGTNLDSPKWLD